MPDWYPEEELERHGIAPDDFNEPACYALSLAVPEDFDALREAWYSHYDVEPPEPLVNAVEAQHALAYVGAAKRLRARLADHVRGDVRQAGVLAVCPCDAPFERETGIAIDYSNAHPGVTIACNGSWF